MGFSVKAASSAPAAAGEELPDDAGLLLAALVAGVAALVLPVPFPDAVLVV